MQLPLTGFSVTPDLALVTNPVMRGPSVFLAIVKCAFSQDRDDLMKKVRCEVEGWLQITLVIVILISENCPYCSPKEGTQTWSFFSQLDISFSKENFLTLPQSIKTCAVKLNEPTSTSGSCSINKPDSSSPLDPSISTKQSEAETNIDSEAELEPQPIEIKPIMVAGHMWCNIRDVQYHVWTKEDRAQRIDLDDRCFFKFIYPHIKMGEAEQAIRKGLSAVKKGISELLSISASKSVHYHDNDSEEFIDIEQELGINVDDENHERQENVQPQATATHMASTDPLETGNSCQGQSRRNIAHDINYFFWEEVQEEESLSLCNICNYLYSAKSSTTMHHGHLDSQHLLVNLDKIEENNWPVQSKYLMATFERGYTFNTLQEALNHPGAKISHLLPPPPPGVDNRVPVGKLPKGDPSVDVPKFSIQGLCEFLVDFIVSDDQAIYVMECPQFHWLILNLHHNLQDTDIPHHTKTCKLVLQHWQEHFMQLRVELKRAIGAISFTADIWSANKVDSYLVMTTHWIGHESGSVQSSSGQLAIKAALIAFHCLPTSHTGEEIAKAILHLIDCAEIPVEKVHV
ncbi:hypothetical protein EDC04DRAFT_2916032 [Pisolithus marmoratus]|nr:hypothetical protein EDC04DRAFT_2916032 [Pisolithus marmoratus]